MCILQFVECVGGPFLIDVFALRFALTSSGCIIIVSYFFSLHNMCSLQFVACVGGPFSFLHFEIRVDKVGVV